MCRDQNTKSIKSWRAIESNGSPHQSAQRHQHAHVTKAPSSAVKCTTSTPELWGSARKFDRPPSRCQLASSSCPPRTENQGIEESLCQRPGLHLALNGTVTCCEQSHRARHLWHGLARKDIGESILDVICGSGILRLCSRCGNSLTKPRMAWQLICMNSNTRLVVACSNSGNNNKKRRRQSTYPLPPPHPHPNPPLH